MKYLLPTTLESDRLILRMFREEDWQDLHAYYSDEANTKYTVGRALTEGETWRIMAGMIGHWSIRGYGPYALEEKTLGKVIGVCGLWYPNDWPEPEIKWALAQAYQGKGYASEAARNVQCTVREFLPNLSLISLIDARNEPSIKLALAIGSVFEKKIPFRGGEWAVYRHPR